MKIPEKLSRRGFLQATGAVSGSTWLRLNATLLAGITQAACSAKNEEAAFSALSVADATDIAAIAARIIPTTDTPGATEAGVIHFFDQAFANETNESYGFAIGELGKLNDSLDGRRFAALSETEQDELLKSIEDGPFFRLLREMTIFGFFAMSSYGGNKEQVGWKLIGFEGHRGAWQYPFGHYDAEVHESSVDGE